MKKHLLLLLTILIICVSLKSKAQMLVNSSIDITGGYTSDGFATNVNYNVILEPAYIKVGVYYSNSKNKYQDYTIPYSIFSVNGGYFYPLFLNNSQSFRLSAGIGAVLGYEIVNNGNNELDNGVIIKSESSFIYGGFGTLETEVAISEKFWVLAKYTQYYHLNSNLGNTTLYMGLGIRIYLN